MDAFSLHALGHTDKPFLVLQDKQSGSDTQDTYEEFEQALTIQDDNRQHQFTDETCTYCNKKCNTETICFAKCDDDK